MPKYDKTDNPNRGHIDPGDPGRVETYHPNGPDAGVPYGGDGQTQWRYDERHPAHLCHPAWCGMGPSDGNYHTPVASLPTNLGPGSLEDQKQRHFAPEGAKSLGRQRTEISQADMGPMPTAVELVDDYAAKGRPGPVDDAVEYLAAQGSKGRPEREGPDYGRAGMNEPDVEDAFWIKLSIAPEAIPKRTEWILKNVVPTALRSFVRHNLRYRDTDQALGLQGQFSEIYHITAKLKRQIWDRTNPESVATGEVQEQLESLIGHALLALDLLDKGNKDGR